MKLEEGVGSFSLKMTIFGPNSKGFCKNNCTTLKEIIQINSCVEWLFLIGFDVLSQLVFHLGGRIGTIKLDAN